MSTRPSTLVAMCVLIAGTTAMAQVPPLPPPDQTAPMVEELVATQGFEERIDRYVAVHRVLEAAAARRCGRRCDMSRIQASMQALAHRIRVVRAEAQQGDLITPDVARMFRRRIATCLPAGAMGGDFVENAEDEEGVPAGPPPALHVNMEWPEQVPFGFVPPQMLAALPRLPAELQYRIIGNALVLWDHHANLIVDFLPGAFITTS